MLTFIRRFPLWQRFVALGLIGLAMAAIPLSLYVSEAWKAVSQVRLEKVGIPVVTSLLEASQAAQTARGVATAQLSGVGASQAQIDSSAAATQKARKALEDIAADGDTPGLLKTRVATALKDWDALAADVQAKRIDVKDSRARHTALADGFMVMAEFAVDQYQLSQDPEADNYHLIMASVVYMPGVTDTLAALRAQGADAIGANAALSIEDRISGGGRVERAGYLHKQASRSFEKAIEFDEDLGPRLKEVRGQADSRLAEALKLAGSILLNGDKAVAVADYRARMTDAIKSQETLRNAALAEIQRMLDARESALVRTEIIAMTAILLLMLIGTALCVLVTRSVTGPVGEAVSIAEALAAGDLTRRLAHAQTAHADEVGRLMQALSNTVVQLNGIVGGIKVSTETINHAAIEIAQGNSNLSQRTEEQASSLEETASSMEELTTTVRENAENARQANELAGTASTVAARGGDVVRQVVETMNGITDASKKIADIIGVIDGIAFQTNILALNAAVEAARAGEQGRGFAVVASEVRSLAQRSAAAAKEIKDLISDSVVRVETGARQVGNAGATMDEVVGAIQKLAGIMAHLASASDQQSAGIGQVNTAVTQMDEVTQQNAALVEQAAAAAESLKDQAAMLARAVQNFRVDATEGANPGASFIPTAAASDAAWDGVSERRGSQRAKNVTRLPKKNSRTGAAAKPDTHGSVETPRAPQKSTAAAGGDWAEF